MDRYEEFEELARAWKPPAELARYGARPVRLSPMGLVMAILIGILFAGAVAVVIALGAVAGKQTAERLLLREHGRDTAGVVTRHWRDSSEEQTRMVAYRFEWQGRPYEGRAQLPVYLWNKLAVGSPLEVRFAPENPAHNRPSDWESPPQPAWVRYLLGGMLAVIATFLLLLVRKQMRLLSEGRPAPGIVRRYSSAEHGKNIHYEFRVLHGGIHKGKTGPARKPPPIGSTICVIYERDNPRRNAKYPLDLVKVAPAE